MENPQRSSRWRDEEYDKVVAVKDVYYQENVQIEKARQKKKSELLNGGQSGMTSREEPLVFNSNEDVPSPTTEEVRTSIQRLKNNQSASSDGIPAELLKAADINFINAFHQLLVKIWNAETMPN
uniref:Uncharacterized protein n=1 Tax=Megaselia scalaris TaxID=36166 RepID=T1GHF7_MEGSC